MRRRSFIAAPSPRRWWTFGPRVESKRADALSLPLKPEQGPAGPEPERRQSTRRINKLSTGASISGTIGRVRDLTIGPNLSAGSHGERPPWEAPLMSCRPPFSFLRRARQESVQESILVSRTCCRDEREDHPTAVPDTGRTPRRAASLAAPASPVRRLSTANPPRTTVAWSTARSATTSGAVVSAS